MKTAISVTLIFLICPAIASAQLTVHEWGTFTSLQDESGQAIGGINSDDEPVPQFVHRLRVGLIQSTPSFSQGLPRCFPDVTMRLETPVLYFHSPKGAAPTTLDVKATFNGGWLTEFYPYAAVEASGFSASGVPGKLTSQSKGTLKWTGVQIDTDGELQKTTDHVWIAPRNVDAAAVSVANQQHKLETEKYLFYRGVAHLDAPLRIRSDGKLLHFEPQIDADAKLATAMTIKNIWQYQMRDDGKSAFRMIEPMQVLAGSTGATATPATFADAEFSTENLGKLRLAMRQALVADGLFTDEAEALLATWELSYFKSRGMRVLFLTPQVWTDHYLPLELSVAAKITRTMVGRIELVTPLERAGLQQIVRSTDKQAQDEAYQKLGRFRNGLVLDEQQQHPSKELAEFISSRNLEGFLAAALDGGSSRNRREFQNAQLAGFDWPIAIEVTSRRVTTAIRSMVGRARSSVATRARLQGAAVELSDLLGRKPVNLDTPELQRFLAGKVVLVTGAGGSIGSEICRQTMKFCPSRIILLDRAEHALFEIDRELRERWVGADIVPVIADMCDAQRIAGIFNSAAPQVVFHCAAHKHVPMMEANPGEAVKNNIFGTKTVADAALACGVAAFVMVSTDKAVNPTSVMGATKRVAEMYVQSLNESGQQAASSRQPKHSLPAARCQLPATRFVAVRFGNVLGSSGSVVPIFRKQIEAGGPVTVTHPDMCRFFMTIPEASQLVMQAGAIGQGGEIFVLDMGEPVKILDLASEMIRRAGLQVGEDIQIQISGVRPGEKLFEELAGDDEQTCPTSHEKIRVWQLPTTSARKLRGMLESLETVIDCPRENVIEALSRCVPEYQPDTQCVPTSIRIAPAAAEIQDQATALRKLAKAQAA